MHLSSVKQWRQRWNKLGLTGLYEGAIRGDRGSERHSNSKRRVIEAQGRLDHGQRGELLYLDNDAVSLIGRNLSLPSLL